MINLSILFCLFLSAGIISATPDQSSSSDIFTATSSKIVNENSKYVLHVTLESTARKAQVFTASINLTETESRPALLYTSEEVTISPGQSAAIEIITKELPSPVFNLTLRGVPVGSTDPIQDGYEASSRVYKNSKHISLLLQSDKVIYKPGETVNFRVVMICTKFRPLNNQIVNITIMDPQRNIIKFLPNQEVNNGIYSSKFQLSNEPNLGDWKIKVVTSIYAKELLFSVEQYVLPKFKVEIKAPNFVTYNSSKFQAEIKASYTYGKPITGEVEVTLKEYSRYTWSHSPMPPTVVKKATIPASGSQFVEFDIATELNQKPLTYTKEFIVSASVTDSLTGKQQNGTKIIKVHQYPYKIEMIETPRNYKPGFPLELKFKVTTQDDIPISDPNPQALKIEHGFSCNAEEGIVYYPIPSTGIVSVTFNTPSNEFVSTNSLKVTYKDYSHIAYPPSKSTTPSKVYMVVKLENYNPEIGSNVGVNVVMNKEFESLNYLLYGKTKILDNGRIAVSPAQKVSEFQFDVPRDAAPEGKLIVYTVVKGTNEIVAESVKFNVKSSLENNLTISLDKEVGEPGDPVKISLETKKDSLIAVRGVDQSVLLLKEDKDITIKTIEGEAKSYNDQVNYHRNWGGSSNFQAFEESGVNILTNGLLESPIRYPVYPLSGSPIQYEQSYAQASFAPNLAQNTKVAFTTAAAGSVSSDSSSRPEVRIRTKFPETWLWKEIQANDTISTLQETIPDTITSWFISGFALSPSTGIGVSTAPTILRTFRPFFLSLNVPYSVVKGEIFGLQVLVHNYIDSEVNAQITVQNPGHAMEFQEESNKAASQSTKSLTIGPNQVQSVTFVVKFVKFGTQSLDIKGITTSVGRTAQAGDAISRPFIVKPPGQKQTLNQALLVDLRSSSPTKETLSVELPPKRVQGADDVKFSVISDILGSTISNLDKLLKMPTGCGEQNMVHFVPDIVILEYLKSSGTLTPQIKSKALKFLESGYQRQLTYRHNDGSFSAFGKYDRHGSTFLTAFVLRSFVAARPYITIDDQVLVDAIKFLGQKQQSDGSFVEHGLVLQNELKGGAVESLSLSAYVTLALVESQEILDSKESLANITIVKDKALEFVGKTPMQNFDDSYAAALVTYTLKVARHPNFQVYKQVLEKLAKRDNGLKFWEPKKVETPVNKSIPHPWVPRIKPVSVEMTSYALLVAISEGNLDDALPIGKWLIQQRTEEGGFISTQDTVVGLTALAKFAMATTSGTPDMSVKVTYEGGFQEFQVDKNNQIVLQEAALPNTVRSVQLDAKGTGTALAQFTCSFYVEEKVEEPAFTVDVTKEENGSKLKLGLCTSYIHEKSKDSNMAVLEVNLPSGFTFDTDELESLKSSVNKLKRYELENGDSQLNIYFESLNSTNTCLSLQANRVFKVANPAKAYIQVYDYYDTTLRGREFYESPNMPVCDICIGEASCAVKNCV